MPPPLRGGGITNSGLYCREALAVAPCMSTLICLDVLFIGGCDWIIDASLESVLLLWRRSRNFFTLSVRPFVRPFVTSLVNTMFSKRINRFRCKLEHRVHEASEWYGQLRASGGHTRPKIDSVTRRRHNSRPPLSSSFSSLIKSLKRTNKQSGPEKNATLFHLTAVSINVDQLL